MARLMLPLITAILCGLPCLAEEGPPIVNSGLPFELRDDITTLNLVNGLELSQDQLTVVVDACKQWREIRDAKQAELDKLRQEIEPTLVELRRVLAANQEIPPELASEVHRFTGQSEELIAAMEREGRRLAQQILTVLNVNQLALLDEYRPCLIPPKNRDTSAIGAPIGDTTPLARTLDLVRRMPPLVYQRERTRVVDGMVQRVQISKRIEVTPEQKNELLAVLDEARRLSDVDFEARREELARKLMIFDDPEAERERNEQRRVLRVRLFLLDPNLPELLADRINADG